MRTLGLLAAILAGSAFVTTGCGRNLDDAKVATPDLNPGQQRLVRASRAFTDPGSPGAAVMKLVQEISDRAGPAALPAYDARIPSRVGAATMLGALRMAANILDGTTPAVVRGTDTDVGQLVVVELLNTSGNDRRYSFLLRRERGQWTVVYDSLLVQGLRAYVQSIKSSDPSKPSATARLSAEQAVSTLELAASDRASRKRLGLRPVPGR